MKESSPSWNILDLIDVVDRRSRATKQQFLVAGLSGDTQNKSRFTKGSRFPVYDGKTLAELERNLGITFCASGKLEANEDTGGSKVQTNGT